MNPFSIEYNGITIDANQDNYTVNNLEGVDGVDIRVSSDLVTGKDGGNIWAQKYGMRTIGLEGVIRGVDAVDFIQKKNALVRAFGINNQNRLVITMWDGSVKSITAKVVEAPFIQHVTGRVTFCNYRVELLCPFPYFSDETSFEGTIELVDALGFPVPMPVPSPITGGSENLLTVVNNGDVAYFAEFRISNEVENPTVTNTTTGEAFTIETSLVDGEYIDVYVDQNGFFVTKDDGSNYMSFFRGTFPQIIQGGNDIRFTASEYSSTARLRVTFSSKYLTI